jgi:SAM-dependent methyltransferase
MPLDIAKLAPGLELRDPGLWFARRQAPVSYPAHGNAACLAVEDRSFWFRHRNRCIVSLVRRYSPDGAFLDIGGGNGFVARGLTAAGISCVLVEPGIDGALAAHSRGIDPVICARLEDTGLPPASIAAAGLFDVLEHIEDEAAALRQVHLLLKPGGRLFLTVPAYQFLYSADDTAAGHFRRYTISGLSHALAGSGFRVGFVSYMFAPLPPLVFLLRTVPSRLGMRRGTDPERDTAEHAPNGVTARLMDRLLDAEFARIDSGRTLPIGASCLCMAIKE